MPKAEHPYWAQHTIVLGPSSAGSGGKRWKCKYCDRPPFNSTITRVIRHVSGIGGKGIGGCKSVPKEIAYHVIQERAQEFRDVPGLLNAHVSPFSRQGDDFVESDDDTLGSSGRHSLVGGKRPRALIPIATSFHMDEHGDGVIGASTYATGSSCPTFEIGSSTASGSSPSRQIILHGTQTTLSCVKKRQHIADVEIGRTIIECNLPFDVLRTEQWKRMIRAIAMVGAPVDDWSGVDYQKMRSKMLDDEMARISRALNPVRESWEKFGCSILSNGWSNIKRRRTAKILVSSCLGTYLLRAIDVQKGGGLITSEFIFHHIREAIMEVGPNNVVQVITDHVSNCASMGKMVEEEFPSVVWTPCASYCLGLLMDDIKNLPWVSQVMNKARQIVVFFRRKLKALSILREFTNLEIIHPPKARFACMFIELEWLHALHTPLREAVLSSLWLEWNESSFLESERVQRACLDCNFWEDVQSIATSLRSLLILLRMTYMEGCTMGLLYHLMEKLYIELDSCISLDAERVKEIKTLVQKRWKWMRRPIHGMAGLLHPLWKSHEIFKDQILLELRDSYLSHVYSEEEHICLDGAISMYLNSCGPTFSRAISKRREVRVKPITWWETYGYCVPHLQKCAIRLLSQDCSASACETISSSYSLLHAKIRNRLSNAQLERLVYCRANLKLLQRKKILEGPKQVDPNSIDFSLVLDTPTIEDDQASLYAQLQQELETIARKVSRTHAHIRRRRRVAVAQGPGRECGIGGILTYTRRGKGSRSMGHVDSESIDYMTKDDVEEPLEDILDSDGNIITNEDYASSFDDEESRSYV